MNNQTWRGSAKKPFVSIENTTKISNDIYGIFAPGENTLSYKNI